eukprot:Protomagalhaensia_sp_Gyna_25__205@NODE_1098_length_2192_cov_385_755690_g868_i0_p2_GENE_NODE_1098_length_2192_cov_385_755690_g868_i0NODE_1098_length_2192_cov_385_755690_g868_i0_p2_ORF_typecomplete_len270_score56_50TPR_18/PF13512_6/2_2e02TPR_18/PF13512_6/4_9e06ANAPC3/PF12895_7/1_2e02ANAPC3/PF12895_7/2_7e06TPR_16/PF13432_6/4e02TPR_16/PF13432_6/1_3e05TPR_15/PF13429_6/4_5e03TPR_15/PF13429_6/5_9e06TPR_14/PF13428_6/4_9e05TPR_19/PF14559_6/2_8e03TPR_19/PF14559_6/0_063TPR_19/PF14559_6/0_00028BTAD/PF03704_
MAVVEEVNDLPKNAAPDPPLPKGDEKAPQFASGEATSQQDSDIPPKHKDEPEDIPPQIHYQNQRYHEARSGWERQTRSCEYVLERTHRSIKGDGVEEPVEDEQNAPLPSEKLQEYIDLRRKAQLNLALVCLKLNDFGAAVEHARRVLAEQPENEKALYRKSLGLFEQGKILEAAETVRALSGSTDPAVATLKGRIERQVVRKAEVEKKMMQGVLEESATSGSGSVAFAMISWVRKRSPFGWLALAVGVSSILLGSAAVWGRKGVVREKV